MIQAPSLTRRGETFSLFGVLPEIASAFHVEPDLARVLTHLLIGDRMMD
jgi:hypothetical protein